MFPYFLNYAHTDLIPARAWFLKIDPVWIVGMSVCVCLSAPKVNMIYSCHMATVVIIINGRGLGIGTRLRH